MENLQLSEFVKIVFETSKTHGYKFGYYNYCPLSKDGTKLLSHKLDFEGRMPTENDVVELGFFNMETKEWHRLALTKVFNWQQGAMLQWMGPDYDSRVIFNDWDGQKYISRIVNIRTKEEKTIPAAIYGVHPSGDSAISLRFERSFYTRAYSYAWASNEHIWNKNIVDEDGIIHIDLNSGEVTEILSIRDILKFDFEEANPEVKHWVEHIMLNPEGTNFAFFHRYSSGKSHRTRCVFSDFQGNILGQHKGKQFDRLSHFGWNTKGEYALFVYFENKLNTMLNQKKRKKALFSLLLKAYRTLLKPFVPKKVVKSVSAKNRAAYILSSTHNLDKQRILNIDLGDKDGHPSFSKCGRFLLTDTYADENNFRNLVIHDLQLNQTYILGKFNSHFNNCGWRADLHPRFSWDEQKVIVDVNLEGVTQVMVLDISGLWLSLNEK